MTKLLSPSPCIPHTPLQTPFSNFMVPKGRSLHRHHHPPTRPPSNWPYELRWRSSPSAFSLKEQHGSFWTRAFGMWWHHYLLHLQIIIIIIISWLKVSYRFEFSLILNSIYLPTVRLYMYQVVLGLTVSGTVQSPRCSSAAAALLGLKKLLFWNRCNVSNFFFFSFAEEMRFTHIPDSGNAIRAPSSPHQGGCSTICAGAPARG